MHITSCGSGSRFVVSFGPASCIYRQGRCCCRVRMLYFHPREATGYVRQCHTLMNCFLQFQKLDIIFPSPHRALTRGPVRGVAVRTSASTIRVSPADGWLFISSQNVRSPPPLPCSWRRCSHDDAGDWDAAALVAVALDALCLAAAAGGLGGLDYALDGRDGCGAGSVRHFVLRCVWLGGLGCLFANDAVMLSTTRKGAMMSADGLSTRGSLWGEMWSGSVRCA